MDHVYKTAVVGGGMIGSSLAMLIAGNGIPVIVKTSNREAVSGKIAIYFQDLVDKGLVTEAQVEACTKLVSYTTEFSDIADVEIVFECVVEKLDVKHAIYSQLMENCNNLKAIVSSSSAISPADLADGCKYPEKVMVGHPYNPPHLVPCVELVKNDFTDAESLKAVYELLEYCGREVCTMNKPAPGFIANRLQHALYREAMYMVEQGICGPEDIDKCIRSSWGPRYTSIGLFEHFDYAGLDLIANIEQYLYPDLCDTKEVHPTIKKKMEEGNLGYKTGQGVYDWTKYDMDAFRNKTTAPYLKFFNWKLPEV